MNKEFTITVFSENRSGILSRIIGVITRRHINIESLSASESSIEGIHRITILVVLDTEGIRKLVDQIDKQVDVLKAFYYENHELVYQEIALYKIPIEVMYDGDQIEQLIRNHHARILRIEENYIVVEKTGHEHENVALYQELKKIGIYEYTRSGRVAIVKPMERLNNYLASIADKVKH